MSPREAVLALLEAMRAPAHVAVLSLAYKKKTGRAIKDDHKHGGMLNFIRTELKDEVLTLTLTLTLTLALTLSPSPSPSPHSDPHPNPNPDQVLLVGSGNDSFAQLATPSTRAVHLLHTNPNPNPNPEPRTPNP